MGTPLHSHNRKYYWNIILSLSYARTDQPKFHMPVSTLYSFPLSFIRTSEWSGEFGIWGSFAFAMASWSVKASASDSFFYLTENKSHAWPPHYDATPPPGSQCIQLAKHSKGAHTIATNSITGCGIQTLRSQTVCDIHADNKHKHVLFQNGSKHVDEKPIRYLRKTPTIITYSISITIALQASFEAPLTE